MFDYQSALRHQPVSPDEFLTFSTSESYSEAIETASNDKLRCFLLDNGFSHAELDDHLECGMTLQELAADLEARGISLSA